MTRNSLQRPESQRSFVRGFPDAPRRMVSIPFTGFSQRGRANRPAPLGLVDGGRDDKQCSLVQPFGSFASIPFTGFSRCSRAHRPALAGLVQDATMNHAPLFSGLSPFQRACPKSRIPLKRAIRQENRGRSDRPYNDRPSSPPGAGRAVETAQGWISRSESVPSIDTPDSGSTLSYTASRTCSLGYPGARRGLGL